MSTLAIVIVAFVAGIAAGLLGVKASHTVQSWLKLHNFEH